jgi:hypothetical protein
VRLVRLSEVIADQVLDRNAPWTHPAVRELSGVEAIIRRASVFELDRFERMHAMHAPEEWLFLR